jgi:hypothetical protein
MLPNREALTRASASARAGVSWSELSTEPYLVFDRQTERRPSLALSEPSSARVRRVLGAPSDV